MTTTIHDLLLVLCTLHHQPKSVPGTEYLLYVSDRGELVDSSQSSYRVGVSRAQGMLPHSSRLKHEPAEESTYLHHVSQSLRFLRRSSFEPSHNP